MEQQTVIKLSDTTYLLIENFLSW